MNLKVNKVITSCKTSEQLKAADKYSHLAYKANIISNVEAAYWLGVINGITHEISRKS